MKKGAFIFLLLNIASIVCSAQAFIDNPDYIYGVGVSENEYSADSLAMLSLSRAIYTDVVNESTYNVSEFDDKFSEKFTKSVSLNSSIRVDCAKKYVERQFDEYSVYYYINKTDYTEKHLNAYSKYINEASEYEHSKDPHSINLTLGSLYLAYEEVNNPLLNIFCKESNAYREFAVSEIKRVYDCSGLILSIRKTFSDRWVEVREENKKSLPGFEYRDVNGRWKTPSFFYDEDKNDYTGDRAKYKWALIDSFDRVYRFTYEKIVGLTLVKINVPEEFCSVKHFVR